MRTLYVSDMDGTLLSTDSRITPESAAILTGLNHDGALFTVATARTPATVEPLLRHTATVPLTVVMTGASLWNRTRRAYESTLFIHPSTCAHVAEVMKSFGLYPFVYTIDNNSILHAYHNGLLSKMDTKFIEDRRGLELKRFHIDEAYDAAALASHTVLYFAMGHSDKIFPAAEVLEKSNGYPTSVSAYVDIWGNDVAILEVKAPGTSKADSVVQLKRHYEADRLVVFGDNLNDLSMMEIADVAVAVGNAVDEVKAKADIVIGPNSADSVARFVYDDFHSHS
ncbi:MAG: Cof-type HAD-IIB family hydrolase [Muribaculum sp.]|nr:Cof-type HAD-IIB family hydrolase [Muribaculum sp.]